MDRDSALRFSLDSSLGRLARWLRLLGHDAAWERGDDLKAAMARARSEGRYLLTRSGGIRGQGLILPPSGGKVIRSDRPFAQLVELAQRLPVFSGAQLFSRCADCNEKLVDADPEWARGRVPEFVAQTQTVFQTCPRCQRVFWTATHTTSILRQLREVAALTGQRLPSEEPQDDGAGSDFSNPAPNE
jgi:uncharacterized protein